MCCSLCQFQCLPSFHVSYEATAASQRSTFKATYTQQSIASMCMCLCVLVNMRAAIQKRWDRGAWQAICMYRQICFNK